jgi:hypothetical protein
MESMIRYTNDKQMYPLDETIYYINGYIVFIRRGNGDVNNGYVLLPLNHQYENMDYNDIPVTVHGGLTYKAKEEDGWVIGFDTGHRGDFVPNIPGNNDEPDSYYWTHEDVLIELVDLIDQL